MSIKNHLTFMVGDFCYGNLYSKFKHSINKGLTLPIFSLLLRFLYIAGAFFSHCRCKNSPMNLLFQFDPVNRLAFLLVNNTRVDLRGLQILMSEQF